MNKLGPKPKPFWSYITRKSDDECWLWHGTLQKDGHGRVKFRGRNWLSHRVAWTLTFGEIPDDLCVLHSCDVPACCNPRHLFLGTQLLNIQDRHQKGRSRGASHKGETNPISKLTELDVSQIRALASNGIPQRTVSRKFNVSEATVSMIVNRKKWKHI